MHIFTRALRRAHQCACTLHATRLLRMAGSQNMGPMSPMNGNVLQLLCNVLLCSLNCMSDNATCTRHHFPAVENWVIGSLSTNAGEGLRLAMRGTVGKGVAALAAGRLGARTGNGAAGRGRMGSSGAAAVASGACAGPALGA
jgi:hypothetical protein